MIEAATVVAITGAMAIAAVPIAANKIEDSKLSAAAKTTESIVIALTMFYKDTSIFPIAAGPSSFEGRRLSPSAPRAQVLRSGVKSDGTLETDNEIDPDLDIRISNPHLKLWANNEASATKANADSNLNNHLVIDGVGYAKNGNLAWLGPYIPTVDQDPWGRNYLVYVKALDPNTLEPLGNSGQASKILVPQLTTSGNTNTNTKSRIYAWAISAGPDEMLQTAPTDSIMQGDDVGAIIALPPVVRSN